MPPRPLQTGSKREILVRIPLFRELTSAELDEVAAHAMVLSHARGATILRKGDPATGMLILVQGRVRVSVLSANGKELTLRILGMGQVLGELSLLDGQERSADVMALTDCVLLHVTRSYFLSLLSTSTDLCLRLMKTLCERVRNTSLSFEELALFDLPTRLWHQLLRFAVEHGVRTQHGTLIPAHISQVEIAAMVGASREAVNRQLKSWASEGLITNEGGRLTLLTRGESDLP